jgi:type VI secretion system protein ImpM
MSASDAPGWFGKLSMLGDFASRRLEPAWVLSCDQWLSAGVQASQAALGERWRAAYLAAPVWRFAWGPGLVDARWWFGVLMPSCDNVGRYFPLLIAQPREHPPLDRVALDHLELWWAHQARCGLATLAEGATLQAFEDALAQGPPWPAVRDRSWTHALAASGRESHDLAVGATLVDVAGSLAAAALRRRLDAASAWWPVGEPGARGRFTLAAGLPPPQAFAEMLAGRW